MSPAPWAAEREIDPALAERLIVAHFPEFAGRRARHFGSGWDNTAFLVGDEWVFRFPRRAVAVGWLAAEIAVLPRIAGRLPLPIPAPCFVGRPSDEYPWPFAGYRLLPGRTACGAALDEAARLRLASSLGAFLAALHGIGAEEAATIGAKPDAFGRLDVPGRAQRSAEVFARLAAAGHLDDAGPLLRLLEAPAPRAPGACALVHGDLYARHLLVDERGGLSGVIDWGDVHLGDPAVDLAIAHAFLPPAARAAYGPIDDATWGLARLRALLHASHVLPYAVEVGDEALARETRLGLGWIAAA